MNTIAVLSTRSSNSFCNLGIFSDSLTMITCCVMRSVAFPAVPIVTTTGFLKYFLASLSTAGGIVALNI
ncbi:hypothetical protein HanRHA438_Chr06g0264021 [Helianthus annuus]|nr:hypothetical protein HanHA300_Chr06g0209131 [Helianthus annuus]KAJ0573232.1 hypothetical protein HanHA89_Chr06g0224491 [Helianthus annuus]KAJ0737650.1 hypothetical protein HanLR1_Chr06g0209341 [Helianthus annuus]KAJ0911515.1 hypothetical protein HanRHA438_Chr06g0264021 [Helianthus annuus]